MSKPVFANFRVSGFTEAWCQLSKEEQDTLWAKAEEINKQFGGKILIMCDSRWANEGTVAWGVEEYPDIDAYQNKTAEYEKLNWWRYFTVKSILGTKMEE
jgi:hypothetical protein